LLASRHGTNFLPSRSESTRRTFTWLCVFSTSFGYVKSQGRKQSVLLEFGCIFLHSTKSMNSRELGIEIAFDVPSTLCGDSALWINNMPRFGS
jgi:hypothetical protein